MPLNTTVVDRDVEHPNRIQLTLVEGTTDTYDLTPVPGSVVQAGTAVNASLLNSAGIEVQTPAAGAITAPADADVLPVVQTATLKKITWANIKATLKTYFDTLYAATTKGVTNGDAHDHSGGDGGQIAISSLSGLAPTWHEVGAASEPAFANSWVNYDTAHSPASFCKDALGFVHLRGVIKGGTLNNATGAFTLPAGYVPAKQLIFAQDSSSDNATHIHGSLYVTAGGVVRPVSGGNSWFTLSCSFYVG